MNNRMKHGPKTKRLDGFTVRQRKTIEGVAAGKTQEQAGLDAGYAPSCAASKASHLLERPEAREELRRLLERKGLGQERIAAELERGLSGSEPEGKHGDYVDRLMRLNGIGAEGNIRQAAVAPVAFLAQFSVGLREPPEK